MSQKLLDDYFEKESDNDKRKIKKNLLISPPLIPREIDNPRKNKKVTYNQHKSKIVFPFKYNKKNDNIYIKKNSDVFIYNYEMYLHMLFSLLYILYK